MKRPDWRRLGAAFGVPDVCVEFPFPVTVRSERDGAIATLAERAIGLREGPDGISIEVACGLVLRLAHARLLHVSPGLDGALVGLPSRRSP